MDKIGEEELTSPEEIIAKQIYELEKRVKKLEEEKAS